MKATSLNQEFTEALASLRGKQVVGSAMRSEGWQMVPVELRRKAFFSAGVENARVLSNMQGMLDDYLSGKAGADRSKFVENMKNLCEKEGVGHWRDGTLYPVDDTSLVDLRSAKRLQMVWDTQVAQAQGYAQFLDTQDEWILKAYPCWRFVRVRGVKTPRAYHQAALGEVRRKDDLDFWLSLNPDFGVPYAPWGFNSGCDVEDVSRSEAEELGVITRKDVVKPQHVEINDNMNASADDLTDDAKAWAEQELKGLLGWSNDGKSVSLIRGEYESAEDVVMGLNHGNVGTEQDIQELYRRLKVTPLKTANEMITSITRDKGNPFPVDTTYKEVDRVLSMISPRVAQALPPVKVRMWKSRNGEYRREDCKISVSGYDDETIMHEFVHHVYFNHPDGDKIREKLSAYFQQCIAGEKQLKHPAGFSYYKDEWADADSSVYAGRTYARFDVNGFEMATMHLEKLHYPPDQFLRYWNHQSSSGKYLWREAFIESLALFF